MPHDGGDAATRRAGGDEHATGVARPRVFGYEPVVGDALVANRSTERPADGDFAAVSVTQCRHRVIRVAQGMAAIVEESFSRPVPFDERSDTVHLPPPVAALAARIGAVDPRPTGTMEFGDGLSADGTGVFTHLIS